MRKRCISTFLALVLVLGVGTVPACGAEAFSDVPVTYWGYSYIEKAAGLGLVEGIGHGQFAPENTVRYTDFLTMVTRYFAPDMIEYLKAKTQTGAPWWVPYTMTAYAYGYLDGTIPAASLDAEKTLEEQDWKTAGSSCRGIRRPAQEFLFLQRCPIDRVL